MCKNRHINFIPFDQYAAKDAFKSDPVTGL